MPRLRCEACGGLVGSVVTLTNPNNQETANVCQPCAQQMVNLLGRKIKTLGERVDFLEGRLRDTERQLDNMIEDADD